MADYDFSTERRAYARLHPMLLERHRGSFAVIVGDTLVDVVDTFDAAVDRGFDAAGGPNFLAKRIDEHVDPATLPLWLLPSA